MPRNIYFPDLKMTIQYDDNGNKIRELPDLPGGAVQSQELSRSAAVGAAGMIPGAAPTVDAITRGLVPDESNVKGDILKNITIQAPLMAIPGVGPLRTAARFGAGTAVGTAMDQLINPERSLSESALQSGFDTGLAMGSGKAIDAMIAKDPIPNMIPGVPGVKERLGPDFPEWTQKLKDIGLKPEDLPASVLTRSPEYSTLEQSYAPLQRGRALEDINTQIGQKLVERGARAGSTRSSSGTSEGVLVRLEGTLNSSLPPGPKGQMMRQYPELFDSNKQVNLTNKRFQQIMRDPQQYSDFMSTLQKSVKAPVFQEMKADITSHKLLNMIEQSHVDGKFDPAEARSWLSDDPVMQRVLTKSERQNWGEFLGAIEDINKAIDVPINIEIGQKDTSMGFNPAALGRGLYGMLTGNKSQLTSGIVTHLMTGKGRTTVKVPTEVFVKDVLMNPEAMQQVIQLSQMTPKNPKYLPALKGLAGLFFTTMADQATE